MYKISIFLILVVQVVLSQDVTVKWAEKKPTKSSISILGGKNGSYFTTHVNRDNNLIGRCYDNNLRLVSEKSIDFNVEEKKYGYGGAYFLDNGILHFISENKKKEDKIMLYSGFTDFKLNTFEKMSILDEGSSDFLKTINFGSKSISPDSTKVLVYHEDLTNRRKNRSLVYKVYNSSITDIVNEGQAELPIKISNYIAEDVKVDNFGNVYVLLKVEKERKERQKGYSDFYYKLVVFDRNKNAKEFDFDYPENKISYFDIIVGKNNTFYCAGFLNNLKGNRKSISDEMFFATLNCASLELEKSSKYEISGLYPDRLRNDEDEIPYRIKNIHQKSDGGLSIIAEQHDLVSYGKSFRSYYCDIACIQLSIKMEVESVTRIPKYQRDATNPSIISTFKGDKNYILYEDLTVNLNAETDGKTKKDGRSSETSGTRSLFLLTIDSDGKPKKEIIYNYKEMRIRPRILTSKVIRPGEILLNADDQIGLFKIN